MTARSTWAPLVGRWSLAFIYCLGGAVNCVRSEDLSTIPVARKHLIEAVGRALPPLQAGAAGAAEERTCFTCHNQALPVMALTEARRLDLEIDQEIYQSQVQHTVSHLKRGKSNYEKAKGQGGQVMTAGYALWTLEASDYEPDELTNAVVNYLVKRQKEQIYWSQKSERPPTSGSHFTNTYLAVRALTRFGQPSHQDAIDRRIAAVSDWVVQSKPKDNEDRVFRLRLVEYLDVDSSKRREFMDDLKSKQADDGGWAQTDEMQSDVYATATALVALMRSGESPRSDVVGRGIRFLLDRQLDDGTWHVVTRAKGFQKYFESGFPHGKDQFISAAATSWAVIALCLATPNSG